jgi:multidrug efflux pump
MVDELRKDPSFINVYNRLKWDGEQFQVTIDREHVADMHVPFENIANTISTLLGGRTIGKSDDQDVILQMNQSALANPNILQQLYTRNTEGKMVPLSQLLSINVTTSPESFGRYERLRADTIYVSLAPNVSIATAVKKLNNVAKANLPPSMQYTFVGEAKSFLESNDKMSLTFLLALVFIYLVLVAQFESFIDPFVIMITVPFAMIGAMATLKIFGGSLNIYSDIGLITLIGLIAKHGILITEFANRLRGQGKTIHEAIIESALLRLRPILMTTAAMILGAMPLAFAFGAGAETRQQIGMVITGGLFFGTFFSLIVVPIMYTFLAPYRRI